MINDKFEPIHLIERKITTPLFWSAKEALSGGSDIKKQTMKYMVIDSNKKIPETIFFNAPICPVFIHNKKSYIYLQGECFYNYFLARKSKDIVLTEEQIWKLLMQLCKALIELRNNGIEHYHIKEYAIRRVNEDNFRLIYHPNMNTPLELIEDKQCRWYQFYFAPQQLGDFSRQEVNSCVFSIGAMILNIMNPLDSKRDIYSYDKYEINAKVIQQKLRNAASGIYSNRLVDIIRVTMNPDYTKRITLEELLKIVLKYDPISKKNKQIEKWKQNVSARMSKSKQKKKSPPKDKTVSVMINFERGTFGGQTQGNSDSEEPQKSIQQISISPSKDQKVQMTYKDYYDSIKKQSESKSKKNIEKSPSAPAHVSLSKEIQQSAETFHNQDESGINMQELSLFEDGKQEEVLTYEINQFNEKTHQYHIKLQECLQPLQILVKQMRCDGTWINENIYYGVLINGRRNGIGLEVFPNREYYYGHFKDDLFHGQGFYFWHNSQYFLGIFEAGNKVEGSWEGKCKYVGQIKRNRRHGIGSCYYPTGKIYQGQWYEGKYQGSGIITEPSGERFMGLFRAGKKWGKGTYFTDNCRITGIWDGDQTVGSVEINYDNGSVYIGLINNEFDKHGEGEMRFKSAVVCKGKFQIDEFVRGEVRYSNGQKYIGQMKDYKRHGFGKYYYATGRIAEGKWLQGRLEAIELQKMS